MRLRLIFRLDPPFEKESDLFSDVLISQRTNLRAQFVSLLVHGLVLASVPFVARSLSRVTPEDEKPVTYHVEMMRLDLPNRFFPLRVPQESAGKSEASRKANRVPTRSGKSGPNSQRALMAKAAAPPAIDHPHQGPLILQPDPEPQPAPAPQLPNLAFWKPPTRKLDVKPGQAVKDAAPPKLDAPPSLSRPNPEPSLSAIASHLPDTTAQHKLVLENSSVTPVRMRGQSSEAIASFEMPQSDAVSLMSISNDFSIPPSLAVPKSLVSSPRPQNEPANSLSPASSGAQSGANAASGESRQTAPAPPASASPATSAANPTLTAHDQQQSAGRPENKPSPLPPNNKPSPSQPDNKPSPQPEPAAQRTTSAIAAAAPAPVAPAPAAAATAPAPPRNVAETSAPKVIRRTNPSNGNFDVVVLQSASHDDSSGAPGLSGNPVYTVYLSVGDGREWMLEYCVPSAIKATSSFRVQIDNPGPVSAPYPLSTAIPDSVKQAQRKENVVLHARLDAEGIFRDVKAPVRDEPWIHEVVTLLGEWRFRPALRDLAPVEVEVLLIIPPSS